MIRKGLRGICSFLLSLLLIAGVVATPALAAGGSNGAMKLDVSKYSLNDEAIVNNGVMSMTIPNPKEDQFAKVLFTPTDSPNSILEVKSLETKIRYRMKVTGHGGSAIEYFAIRLYGDDAGTFITVQRSPQLDQWYEGEFGLNETKENSGKRMFAVGDVIKQIRVEAKNKVKEDQAITVHVEALELVQSGGESAVNKAGPALADKLKADTKSAMPGTEIVIPNGIYSGVKVELEAHGTAEKPIIIRSETPGGVQFTGDSSFKLRGEHFIFQGFYFHQANPISADYVVALSGATNARISNNYFYQSGKKDPYAGIIQFQDKSQHNHVDHNVLQGNVSKGIAVRVNKDNNLENLYNTIDHNYFKDILPTEKVYPNAGSSNGLESVQIGQGYGYEEQNVYTTVEYNLFENVTGDGLEIVSNKTASNVFRHNTFKDCDSGFTLRFGGNAVVDSNNFIHMKYGIRVTDENQIVTNNYFYGVREGAIRIYSGRRDASAPEGNQLLYRPVKNALIANNTIVYPDTSGIVVGDSHSFTPAANITYYEPQDSTIANNLIILKGKATAVLNTAGQNIRFQNNVVSLEGQAQAGITDAGLATADPGMKYDADADVYYPTNGKVIKDAGQPFPVSPLDKDMNGRARVGSPDIGSYEMTSEHAKPVILTSYDVGPQNKWWIPLSMKDNSDVLPAVQAETIQAKNIQVLSNEAVTGNTSISIPIKAGSLKGKNFVSFDIKSTDAEFPAWDRVQVSLREQAGLEEWSLALPKVTGEWQTVSFPLSALMKTSHVSGNEMLDKEDIAQLIITLHSANELAVKQVRTGELATESLEMSKAGIRLGIGIPFSLNGLGGKEKYKGGFTADVNPNEITFQPKDASVMEVKDGVLRTIKEQPGTSQLIATYKGVSATILVTIVEQHIVDVVASAEPQPENNARNTMDTDLTTRWSADGEQWIQYTLNREKMIGGVQTAFYGGDKRKAKFDIEVSTDGKNWKQVFSGESSGTTSQMEPFLFDEIAAKYIRIVGHGNSASEWNSISEVDVIPAASIITRGQFVELLVNGLHLQAKDLANPAFADVGASHKQFASIQAAAQHLVIDGMQKGQFFPGKPLTREQMAVILMKGYGLVTVAKQDASGAEQTGYSDDKQISLWAKGAVKVVKEKQLLGADSSEPFAPKAYVSLKEAQAAVEALRTK